MLTRVATELWQHQSAIRLLPGARLPLRMTVVRRRDGSLLLHSPSNIDDSLARQLRELGPIGHLVAPNRLHHLHVADAQRRFPEAKLYAADGLETKNPKLRVDVPLSQAHERLAADFQCLPLRGAPKLDEWVLFHRSTRTLIVTDLVFHVQQPQGWLTPWVLRAAGTHRRLAMSRFVRQLILDRDAFTQSLEPILALDAERLLMAHGEAIEHEPMAALRAAVRERLGRA